MSERHEFVMLASQEGSNLSDLARRYGISRKTGYKWVDRYEADPAGGLAGGHAMCAFGLVKRRSKWGLLTVNSWSDGWGKNGWLIVPEARFASGWGGGSWACRSVTFADVLPSIPVLGGS